MFFGRYPEAMPAIFGDAWPEFPAAEVEAIREPIDFVGVNYYTRRVVKHDPETWFMNAARVPMEDALTMTTGWEVHPESLTRTLLWVRERYGAIPIYVTENGGAFEDPPTASGGIVDDPLRVACLEGHLAAIAGAMQAGVDVRGYYVWSLLDNFEWGSGYSIRFGIVHVDYATQQRTPKSSARFYRDVIRSNGAILPAYSLPEAVPAPYGAPGFGDRP